MQNGWLAIVAQARWPVQHWLAWRVQAMRRQRLGPAGPGRGAYDDDG
jgi:hypothetical protein